MSDHLRAIRAMAAAYLDLARAAADQDHHDKLVSEAIALLEWADDIEHGPRLDPVTPADDARPARGGYYYPW
jgi:hypothetical protein